MNSLMPTFLSILVLFSLSSQLNTYIVNSFSHYCIHVLVPHPQSGNDLEEMKKILVIFIFEVSLLLAHFTISVARTSLLDEIISQDKC
jgi:hypothetical protein